GAERPEELRDAVAGIDHERARRPADHLLRLARELVGADDAGADDPDVERPDRLAGRPGVAQPISSINRTAAPVRSSCVLARLTASTSVATFASRSASSGRPSIAAARLIQSCVPQILTVTGGRR